MTDRPSTRETGGTETFKVKLARALDDNMHTRQWHNIVDWLIIGMILLSSTEIFLSTFDLAPELRKVLVWVDIVTLIFFTVEVIVRIWVAPLINPKYKGLKGRLKYCFSFWGAIDIISTFPFYLQFIFPLPVAAFKMLRTTRVVRVLRIGRYAKSFSLLNSAIAEKRRELIVSMQFLIIATFILSLVLFFFEHEAQPKVYHNGFVSVVWAFAQYIGDPGHFAETPPVTGIGHIIACIVGLLGIAIVAVPAGIIGAGFTEALEKEARSEKIEENLEKIRDSFQRKLDRETGYQMVRPLITVFQINARCGLKTDEIIDVINHESGPERFRLVNTASTIPTADKPIDTLAVEYFVVNRSYGLMIDRGSKVTICSPSSVIDPGTGNFSFYLAMIGGFNYISRELGDRHSYSSFHTPTDRTLNTAEYQDYERDLGQLLSRPGAWSFTILASSGALEPAYPTHLHFGIGGAKGEEFEMERPLINDISKYKELYAAVESRIAALGLKADHQKYYGTDRKQAVLRRAAGADTNSVIIRIEWDKLLWNPCRTVLIKLLAEEISRTILGSELRKIPVLTEKATGFEGYEL